MNKESKDRKLTQDQMDAVDLAVEIVPLVV